MSMLMPVAAWAVGGIVAWLAGRYHLNIDQQQLVSADILGGVCFAGTAAGGLYLHWQAYMAKPPSDVKKNDSPTKGA